MTNLVLRSPAKLNLFLKVLHKRPDGYHELETIFERISLSDEIRFIPNSTGRIAIICNDPQVPRGRKNLVYRVGRLLQQHCRVTQGVTISIKKQIPVAAGLAGGSSNAATTLLGLNRIWNLGLRRDELVRLGAKIGSDVAFFLYDRSWALGRGRGERISPLNIPRKFWHVLVVPRLRMYTKDVFGRMNLELTKKGADVNIFTLALKKKNASVEGLLLHNDLETSILGLKPGLALLKNRLVQCGLRAVVFSGSGPACYGLAKTEQDALQAAKKLKRYYKRVFTVHTL